jgi:membrane fusion protein (multidrug efflux system)
MTRTALATLLPTLALTVLLASNAFAAKDRTPLVVVDTAKTDQVIKQVPVSGTVTAIQEAQLSTEVQGLVEKVNVDVGDTVKAGTPLLELDREIAQHTLEALQAATRQSSAELADAKRRYDDAKRLRKQSSISENELRLIETEVNVDRALMQQKQAEENLQRARVERHTLRAPFDGVITERLTDTGEWIVPGSPVYKLVAVDRLRIEFRVSQEYYAAIDDRTTLEISLDALPNRKFPASIDAVVPASDPNSRTFLLQASMKAGGNKVTPGMSARGKLSLATGSEGVVVSRDAILRYPDGRVTVWIITPDSEPPTVTEKRVVTGNSFKGLVQIREGIAAGDVVVVKGNESLKEGQAVKIHNQEK